MACRISSVLLDRLHDEAAASAPLEICGLLIGRRGSIESAIAIDNVAAAPAREFMLDPAGHLAVSRGLRATRERIIGCYHSHPSGLALPSQSDAVAAVQPDFYWLIIARTVARLWLSCSSLDPGGRFVSVRLDVATTALQPWSAGANRSGAMAERHDRGVTG